MTPDASILGRTDIRPFEVAWTGQVISLFKTVMLEVVPPEFGSELSDYIDRAIQSELAHIDQYYSSSRRAEFWILVQDQMLLGTSAFEPITDDTAELRRMLVNPRFRRMGLGKLLLTQCESRALAIGYRSMSLSTSVWQQAAISLYQDAGYVEVGRSLGSSSHKSIGAEVERVAFVKSLIADDSRLA